MVNGKKLPAGISRHALTIQGQNLTGPDDIIALREGFQKKGEVRFSIEKQTSA